MENQRKCLKMDEIRTTFKNYTTHLDHIVNRLKSSSTYHLSTQLCLHPLFRFQKPIHLDFVSKS